jgi:DNA-binding transcriptional LysR family regulator
MVAKRAPFPSTLDWAQLQFFREIGRSATLADAGKRIGVTPSAVSQRLSALETSAGAALLLRSRQGLRLTDLGRQTLAACEDMHAAAQRAAQTLKPDAGMTGTVRITCPQGLADTLIVPIVARYLHQHPALGYDLLATDQHLDLRDAGVDLALRFGWARDGHCVS